MIGRGRFDNKVDVARELAVTGPRLGSPSLTIMPPPRPPYAPCTHDDRSSGDGGGDGGDSKLRGGNGCGSAEGETAIVHGAGRHAMEAAATVF